MVPAAISLGKSKKHLFNEPLEHRIDAQEEE